MTVSDVIIVGGGVSGLSAARALNQRGLQVLVLEASGRVGGRALTWKSAPGEVPSFSADLGGNVVSYTHHELVRMCDELGLDIQTLTEEKEFIFFEKGRAHKFFDWFSMLRWRHPLASWDLAVMMRRLEKMCQEIPVDRPWEAPHAQEWDEMTVQEFYKKHLWTRFAYDFLLMLLRVYTACKGHQMSLLTYLWTMRTNNGPLHSWYMTNMEYDEMKVIVGGAQQLADKMAAQLGDSIILNQPVVQITYGDKGVTVKTRVGKKFHGRYLILATPPVTQMQIHFEPPLPFMRCSLLQRCPIGIVMKCVVFYDYPFWERSGCGGNAMCLEEDQLVTVVDAISTPEGGLHGLTVYIYQDHVIRLSEMSHTQVQNEVCQRLGIIFRSHRAFLPVKFFYKIWSSEPYQLGGFITNYPPGTLTLHGRALRAPIGSRIFLAGTETATYCVGDLAGAIDAGQRAAREILHAEGQIDETEIMVQQPSLKYKFSIREKLVPSIDSVFQTLWAVVVLGVALLMYQLKLASVQEYKKS